MVKLVSENLALMLRKSLLQSALPSTVKDKLHILTCISNPANYRSRVELYDQFVKYVEKEKNAVLYTAELIYEGQDYSVTSKYNPNHLQLKSDLPIWSKEDMLNKLFEIVPPDAKYIAWIDADVLFSRTDWVDATISKLQEFDFVQMFTECRDLLPDYTTIPNAVFKGVIHQFYNNQNFSMSDGYGKKRTGHTGYAWACTRDAWQQVEGLIDFSVMGSADYQMACGLLGDITSSTYDKQYSEGYIQALVEWEEKAKGLSVGYVDGLCLHNYHGKKSDRGYTTRWKVLVDLEFDPSRDLFRNEHGMLTLHPESPIKNELEEYLKFYFTSRNEDEHLK